MGLLEQLERLVLVLIIVNGHPGISCSANMVVIADGTLGLVPMLIHCLISRLEALVAESSSKLEMGGRLQKLAAKINGGFGGCGSLFRFV